eukprot:10966768-Ditylum_brightwellii.AAC.1
MVHIQALQNASDIQGYFDTTAQTTAHIKPIKRPISCKNHKKRFHLKSHKVEKYFSKVHNHPKPQPTRNS